MTKFRTMFVNHLNLPLIITAAAISMFSGVLPLSTHAKDESSSIKVTEVAIKHLAGNLFRITAKGEVPTAGWSVYLRPVTYVQEPNNWLIEVHGIKPTGSVSQVISPWEASVEMGLGTKTKEITVRGSGKPITKVVPR